MKKIIIIDDNPSLQLQLQNALTHLSTNKYEIEIWEKEKVQGKWQSQFDAQKLVSNADEDVWRRVILAETNLAMIVADHDLSAFNEVRVSESTLTEACKQSSIPICTYHRKPGTSTSAQELRGIYSQTRSFAISIDISNIDTAAAKILAVADGFETLLTAFNSVSDEIKKAGPASIVSSVLERPGMVTFFSRYATGPTLASDVIDHLDANNQKEAYLQMEKRMPFVLGCWLHNYVLPFPGVLLNEVASASYVNLSQVDFTNHSNHFSTAKYIGPFSGTAGYWWRTELDQLLVDADCEDGVEYLSKKSIQANPSICCVTKNSPAGFYCLVRREPISLAASVGRLSWIPEGADLSRIDTELYDSVAPMMGI
ncbi:hypothetical protein H8L32_23790 [Undibacterium sp. CY18W]|uniref:Uncharacterized protein n=1 Tax=Undibacterium hunanense TaxID=2762292 RepID=A0ABR6ZXA6_9BURK|nr:hypothetical protein [Undibacterium hunanense]MBC3920507.1 hypothetical protein [Undibacterium hunanense]